MKTLFDLLLKTSDLVKLNPEIRNTVVIKIDDVNNYTQKFMLDDKPKDIVANLSCIVPPWENFFMLYKLASNEISYEVYFDDRNKKTGNIITELGWHFQVDDLGDSIENNIPVRWKVRITPYLLYKTGKIGRGPQYNNYINKDGQICTIPGTTSQVGTELVLCSIDDKDNFINKVYNHLPNELKETITENDFALEFAKPYMPRSTPCWVAINFIHCPKQVQVIEQKTLGKRRLFKAKKNQKPFKKTYTLQIDGMKRLLYSAGQIEKLGLKRALHLVRGHFATYNENAPMFGNYVGTVWKPPHLRGIPEIGEIDKDYEITMGNKKRRRPRK